MGRARDKDQAVDKERGKEEDEVEEEEKTTFIVPSLLLLLQLLQVTWTEETSMPGTENKREKCVSSSVIS